MQEETPAKQTQNEMETEREKERGGKRRRAHSQSV